jgi:hypothetical protein
MLPFTLVSGQSATITAPFPLNEADLDFQSINIYLTDETWDDGNLDRNHFKLVNAPDGLTVYAVVLISTTQAVVDLAFNGTDFDTDILNFSLTIDHSELTITSSGVLTTNNLTIDAYNESVTIVPDAPLQEQTLDDRSLLITLTDESFTSTGTLPAGAFNLNNEPAGLSIESVTAQDVTHAVMQLAFPPGNDFDSPISNFNIDVSGDILTSTKAGEELRSNNLTIAAYDEMPQAFLTADSVLEERWLDVRTLYINLVEESFRDYTRLREKNYELVGEPQDLKVASVTGTSATTAEIDLQFNQRDFDSDYPDLRVRIKKEELTQSGNDLETSTLTVEANLESASLEPDQPLREDILNGRVLTITLVNEAFENPGAVRSRHFELINEPLGLAISSINVLSATQVQLILLFLPIDFSSDINDFAVRIDRDVLTYNNRDELTTNPITIQAIGDGPVASLVADSVLTEHRLDARELTIELIQEEFDLSVLEASHFSLVNGPAGLAIESVSMISSTSAGILLSFDQTDFDETIPDFHVLIDPAGLVRSTQALSTNSLYIHASREPEITGLSIPDNTMKIGDHVTVSITVEADQGSPYMLHSGNIGGYPLTDLIRLDNTSYTAVFIVTEGGNDYEAQEDIPVNGVQLSNGIILGDVYDQPIIQGNDLLDANRPVIRQITVLSSGPASIGSEIELMIDADQPGYHFTPTSHVNHVPLSRPNIQVISQGSGDYELRYTVAEGDQEVTEGNLELEIVAVDLAGNQGVAYTTPGSNDVSIDASRPVITRAYISSSDSIIQIGETLEITVIADQPGYRVHPDTRINNVPVGPQVTFTDQGEGAYRLVYTVSEQDGTVSKGNLSVSMVLQDRDPFENTSLAFTTLDPNNVVIVTSLPSAGVSGSTELCRGETATVTITLGGMPPWEFDIFDGSATLTISNIWDPIYRFPTRPEHTVNYTVPRLVDGTGSPTTGFGNALITVHPIPHVEILNLLEIYDLDEDPVTLQYTPEGGRFTGPGITFPPWTFIPGLAGTEDSPHEIIYSYTDSNTCSSADTMIVQVIDAGGYISFERPVACFNDTAFSITGHNDGQTIGTFSVQPEPPAGAFEDLDSNRAVLRPYLYGLSENMDVLVSYRFTDTLGDEQVLLRWLTMEKLEDVMIATIPDIHFCQNEAPIDLSGIPETGVFTGPGVTWNAILGYQFDPSLADLDSNSIHYTYTSLNHCRVSDATTLIVHDAPLADFTTVESCIQEDGGTVQFINRSHTAPGQDVSWSWEFGDMASGGANYSDLMNPSHHYDETGTYAVSLDVRTGNGCRDVLGLDMGVYIKPLADFTWNSNCLTEDPVGFEGLESVVLPDTVASRRWIIYRGNSVIFQSDTIRPTFRFPSPGTFRVSYQVTTGTGCTDSLERPFTMMPTYLLTGGGYFEDFEVAEIHGWTPAATDPAQNSWTYGEVDPGAFPWNAASGSSAWYTDLSGPRQVETSWVQSPCFNFQGYYRPMVSLDIRRSLLRNLDGAALEYTTDNGRTWNIAGGLDEGGLNWYNSDMILKGSSTNFTGWTGGTEPASDEHWYRAVHGMDMLTGQDEVRFRILFSTLGGDTLADGFAFDNFTIDRRTRLSVMEYFTNANCAACLITDSLVRGLVEEVPMDVIDIQYHIPGTGADRIYLENPVPANSRSTLYGVTGPPVALLDGGCDDPDGYPMTYDFSLTYPGAADIQRRSLSVPDFRFTMEADYLPGLEISANIEAMDDLAQADRILYVIVMEKQIVDPEYAGTNGNTMFYNVARKMLPDAAGTLFNQSWTKGQVESLHLTWEDPYIPLYMDSICIVAYMQDEKTGEILQAATFPEYSTVSAPGIPESPAGIRLYPNPAGEGVNIYFRDIPQGAMSLKLYDLSGKIVSTATIQAWQQQYTHRLDGLDRGIYIVEIRSAGKLQVLYREKLIHY